MHEKIETLRNKHVPLLKTVRSEPTLDAYYYAYQELLTEVFGLSFSVEYTEPRLTTMQSGQTVIAVTCIITVRNDMGDVVTVRSHGVSNELSRDGKVFSALDSEHERVMKKAFVTCAYWFCGGEKLSGKKEKKTTSQPAQSVSQRTRSKVMTLAKYSPFEKVNEDTDSEQWLCYCRVGNEHGTFSETTVPLVIIAKEFYANRKAFPGCDILTTTPYEKLKPFQAEVIPCENGFYKAVRLQNVRKKGVR